MARDRVEEVYLDLRQIIKAIIENLTKLLKNLDAETCSVAVRSKSAWSVIFCRQKIVERFAVRPKVRCSFAGSLAEMALAQRVERDRWIDESVAQIAQGLPERGAAAGALFDAGEGFRAGLRARMI